MARYEVHHRTTYHYAQPVAVSHHACWLRPRATPRQQCPHFQLAVLPEPSNQTERLDYFGNHVHQFSIAEGHRQLVVDCVSEVRVSPLELPLTDLTPTCAEVLTMLDERPASESLAALEFRYPSPAVQWEPSLADFAKPFFPAEGRLLACAGHLAAAIHDSFTFDPTATDVSTAVMEAFSLRRGVCQDYAHIMIAALRSQGFAARYVSGYLLTQPPPGKERLVGADASHAWVSVFLPSFGWIDIDPTNRQFGSEEHLTVAYGRDFRDVTPLKGAVKGGGDQRIEIAVTVKPVEPPRSPRLPLPPAAAAVAPDLAKD